MKPKPKVVPDAVASAKSGPAASEMKTPEPKANGLDHSTANGAAEADKVKSDLVFTLAGLKDVDVDMHGRETQASVRRKIVLIFLVYSL